MKVLLLTLLLLLCSTQVFTIKCYTCTGGDADCHVTSDCPNVHFCMVKEHQGTVTRTCAQTCTEDDHTTCCTEDFCNIP